MPPSELSQAQALLAAGRPREAAQRFAALPDTPEAALGLVACQLRLGEVEAAAREIARLPPGARRAALRARLLWLTGDPVAPEAAREARQLAHAEGDTPALLAALTLLAELEWRAGQPRAALHTLAGGLRVCEQLGDDAATQLLAVLARVQAELGSPAKAQRTAQKALARSAPGSPARVSALLALGRLAEARAEAAAGELAPAYLG